MWPPPALYHFRKFEFNPKDGIDNPALSLAEDTGKYPTLLWDQGTRGHPRVRVPEGNGDPHGYGEGVPVPQSIPAAPAHLPCPLADGEAAGEPRFYLLSKGSAETFGFCLHEELGGRGHVVRQVELGGLAQRRGLQDGDRLLQVNGRFVDHLDHQRVSPEHPKGGAEGP